MTKTNSPGVPLLRELIEQGRYRPIVDLVYPIAAAAAAHRYVKSWQKTGILSLNGGGPT